MSRIYIQPSWVDACSDHLNWSGQGPDDRKRKSTELFLKNGQANTALFAEPEQPKKTKKSVPIAHQIVPQSRTLDKLDQQELALHKAYKNEEVSLEEYEELLYALDQKRERAFKSVNKALGRPLDGEAVEQDGLDEKTLNWYDKALTKGCFEDNLGGVEGVNTNSLADDIKILLTGSVIGLIVILTLIHI